MHLLVPLPGSLSRYHADGLRARVDNAVQYDATSSGGNHMYGMAP